MDPHDSERLAAELEPDVAAGRLVLFTGAGFSSDVRSVGGEPVPSSAELCDALWETAFPGEPRDESRLDDLYGCAVARDADATRRILAELLVVDPSAVPEHQRLWFSVPWARAYTLNVDDLDEAVDRRWTLPAPVRSVSALTSGLPERVDGLLSVHLNGRVADFPQLTFSPMEYGERTAVPDPWYQHLAADLRDRPAVFVGTTLDEPPLWQQISVRLGGKESERQASYLVSPRITRARAELLGRLGVRWVPMDAAGFADEVLARLGDACDEGHGALGGDCRPARPPT